MLILYLVGVGIMVVLCSPFIFAGADRTDFPNSISGGFQTLGVGIGWVALALWLLRASVRADAEGIRTQALIPRFVPAGEVLDISVETVPHAPWLADPIAPYVLRRNGRPVKLSPMMRLDLMDNRALLEDECAQLLTAVRGGKPAPAAAGVEALDGLTRDPNSNVYVPIGTTLATAGRRGAAVLLFAGFHLGVLVLTYFLLPVFPAIGPVGFALILGYFIWSVILWRDGESPALLLLRMRVWRQRSETVASWPVMALRDIVGGGVELIGSVVTLFLTVGMTIYGSQRQSLRDVIAGTLVLHDPRHVLAPSGESQDLDLARK